ncbi:MAG: M42 family peptidase [Lachnospiraceae bacterium]|nr:M42 family peptidase [Lachnospiraceae bacterium]
MFNLLSRLCTAKGVSGREEEVCCLIANELEGIADSVAVDKNNNVTAVIGDVSNHNIMLDAHIDEIGFVVVFIDEKGFLKVTPCGGMDCRVVQDSRFKVLTESGEITAVACCMPPHLSDGGEDKAPSADCIYLDTGLPAEKVRELVRLGDTVAYDTTPCMLLNNRFTCCSTDNRASCALLIRVAQLLKEKPVTSGVTLVFTSQEETFGKGASAAAYSIYPDEAISVDVSFARQSGVAAYESGELGKGGMICISPVLSRNMTDKLIELSKAEQLPYQLEVVGGATGTNADRISITRDGIPTALVSVPQRSMHTCAEVVSIDDIESIAKLLYVYISSAYDR